jgi:hypothetical protein
VGERVTQPEVPALHRGSKGCVKRGTPRRSPTLPRYACAPTEHAPDAGFSATAPLRGRDLSGGPSSARPSSSPGRCWIPTWAPSVIAAATLSVPSAPTLLRAAPVRGMAPRGGVWGCPASMSPLATAGQPHRSLLTRRSGCGVPAPGGATRGRSASCREAGRWTAASTFSQPRQSRQTGHEASARGGAVHLGGMGRIRVGSGCPSILDTTTQAAAQTAQRRRPRAAVFCPRATGHFTRAACLTSSGWSPRNHRLPGCTTKGSRPLSRPLCESRLARRSRIRSDLGSSDHSNVLTMNCAAWVT